MSVQGQVPSSIHDPLPPAFHKLAISNLLAQSAEQLTLAAVPIVAVLMLQAGPGQIGVLAAVQSLPFLLLSMPMGLLADSMSRKKLMLFSEILRVLACCWIKSVSPCWRLSDFLRLWERLVSVSVHLPWCQHWLTEHIWPKPMGAWS
ncbi:MFS transporter [Jezberella montanilacus]|uniref:MFS transporter n=1 Tax=Jezberella montanilacus TaxID=323426 RepID=UPI002692B669|nr:MFS transporter [Jezberella montanilacus]